MARNDKTNGSNTPLTEGAAAASSPDAAAVQSGTAAGTAGAAGKSLPAAEPKRFTISKHGHSGPVQSFADVVIDDSGVGHTNNPSTAWHCKCAGYSVADALRGGEQYDGTKPKDAPADA